MTQGMFSAVSGIRSNQTRLNVISNNVANVNTLGYKSSSANFATVFSSTISGGSPPNGTLGGINPLQIGSGSLVSEIASNFSQGGSQFTGKNTDLMVNGDGFFALERIDTNNGTNPTDFFLTRAGNFTLDSNGNLVSSSGNRVRGTSQILGNSNTTLGRVKIPTEFLITKDLDANSNVLESHFSPIGTSTAAGGPIALAINPGAASQFTTPVQLQSFSIGVDGSVAARYSNGDIISVRTNQATVTANINNPELWRREIIHQPFEGGTYSASNLEASDSGTVDQLGASAVFDGGVGLGVAGPGMEGMQLQLQTASVINPSGLLYDGSNNFLIGANSGTPDFGVASSGSRGGINAGALESSNVDLAGEFTNMIISQRGLEASSRVVRTQSEVLQTIIQLV
ncbi:MAG: flagellar hook-basal body complex protein [Cyanobacteria bacterium P01_H01_bin.74]